MKMVITCLALLSLCSSASAQRTPDFFQEFQTAIAALNNATKSVQAAQPAAIKDLGPCLSIFSSLSPDTFADKLQNCVAEDIQLVIADATENKDNVALDCWNPILPIAQALKDKKGGLLLAFQLFRDAKRHGVIGNCTSYINTTIMLQ